MTQPESACMGRRADGDAFLNAGVTVVQSDIEHAVTWTVSTLRMLWYLHQGQDLDEDSTKDRTW